MPSLCLKEELAKRAPARAHSSRLRDCGRTRWWKGAVTIADIKSSIGELYAIEQLARGASAVHRLHPMAKLIATAFYIIAVASYGRYDAGGLMVYAFYPAVMMAVSETPCRFLLRRFLPALPFVLLAGISNVLFDTQTAFFIGPVGVSFGVLSLAVILIKAWLSVTVVLILAATTPMQDLACQLARLRIPAVLVMLVAMTYRYMGILSDEAHAMFTAYTLRAPKQKGIAMAHMGSFTGQLLLRSIGRAERVYAAMKCRGFHGAQRLAPARRAAAADWVFCVCVCLFSVLFRVVNFSYLLGRILV